MRVLIISPRFPPSNAADMQRVRLLLPYFKANGVEVQVLAIDPNQVASPEDPWLVEGLPEFVKIHRVTALSLSWGKIPTLGVLAYRALRALKKAGDLLLASGRFDLIYFSTTEFPIHLLGPYWKKKHGVPFVMDYQDPWVSDYYRNNPQITPPGGRFKYMIADLLNRRGEPKVLRECSGITSVSQDYPLQLEKRYGLNLPSLVIPFPGDTVDLGRVKDSQIKHSVFDPSDGKKNWVYVGRGGGDMALAIESLFLSLQSIDTSNLQIHFIGTSYAAAGQGVKTIEPLAKKYGLEHCVTESPDRIPYSQTLSCLLSADALIVPGSDDPAYTASKIYPYLLSEKPLLCVFHENSSVVSLMNEVGGGTVIPFSSEDSPESISQRILQASIISTKGELKSVSLDEEKFAPYTAEAQARDLVSFWRSLLP